MYRNYESQKRPTPKKATARIMEEMLRQGRGSTVVIFLFFSILILGWGSATIIFWMMSNVLAFFLRLILPKEKEEVAHSGFDMEKLLECNHMWISSNKDDIKFVCLKCNKIRR